MRSSFLRTSLAAVGVLLLVGSAHAQTRQWSLRQELRIGAEDDSIYGLTTIYNVLVGTDGTIYLPQPQDHAIKVFSRDGAYLRSIGRRGEGPGEFKVLSGSGWRGDSLFVFDASLSRMTLFTTMGELVGTIGFRTVLPNRRVLQPQGFNSDGTLWSFLDVGLRPPPLIPELRISREGAVLDTLRYYPFVARPSFPVSHNGRTLNVPHPVNDDPFVVMLPNRTHGYLLDRRVRLDGNRATFRVVRITERGDTLWDRTYRYTPRRLNADSAIEVHARPYAMQLRVAPAAVVNELKRQISAPLYRVPVRSAFASDDGHLWIRWELETGSQERWNVIDASGTLTATVRFPTGATPIAVMKDAVYARFTDSLDVPFLIRYRITR